MTLTTLFPLETLKMCSAVLPSSLASPPPSIAVPYGGEDLVPISAWGGWHPYSPCWGNQTTGSSGGPSTQNVSWWPTHSQGHTLPSIWPTNHVKAYFRDFRPGHVRFEGGPPGNDIISQKVKNEEKTRVDVQ